MSVESHYHGGKRAFGFTSAATDANGNVTVNLASAGFTGVPAVVATAGPTADTNLVDLRITALSAVSVTFNVQRALAITVLALQVLAAKVPAPGIVLQVVACEK